jgi:hypothetical protein
LCGTRFINGYGRFSNQPDKPVHKDAVYTRVCKSAIEAQKKREEAGETDLEPINLGLCINLDGAYNPRYRWIAKPTEKV